MRDFNDYKKGQSDAPNGNGGTYEFIKDFIGRYNGKSPEELYRAVFNEAKKRKAAGTLSDKEIDAFAATLSPFLDDEKRKNLYKIVEKLKKI